MILTSVRIENFKQYGGVHEIAIRDSGLIAVIGANGSGKTTLFEAIEWCLYKPGSLTNRVVRTRNGSGATRVIVRIANPDDGIGYVVERRLVKSGGVEAFVWREDQPGSRLASGTSEVSSYVARHLIGLSHKAFVATFFTRQKELTFFGTLGPTDRRREVANLLGHDAIAGAGGIMRAEAEAAATAAQVASQIHRAAAAGRDFDAELEVADAAIAAASEHLDAAEIRRRESAQRLADISRNLDAARENERTRNLLVQRLTELDGQHNLAVQREGAALAHLEALDGEERARPALQAVAAREAEHLAAVAGHEQERERDHERDRLAAEFDRLTAQELQLADDLRVAVDAARPDFAVDGWSVSPDPGAAIAEAVRLIEVINSLPLAEARQAAERIDRCRVAIVSRDLAVSAVSDVVGHLAVAEAERTRLLADGDPSGQLEAARARQQDLRDGYSSLKTRVGQLQSDLRALEQQTAILRRFDHDRACPTCFRPFSEAEAEVQITLNEDHARRVASELSTVEAEWDRIREIGPEASRLVETLESRSRDLSITDARISDLLGRLEEARATVVAREQALHASIAAAGLSAEPDDVAARAASDRVAGLNGVAASRPAIERILRDARDAAGARRQCRLDLDELGPSRYDHAAHLAARSELDGARAAAVKLRSTDERLAARPRHDEDRGAAAKSQAAIEGQRAGVRAEIAALAFDPGERSRLEGAHAEVAEAERGDFVAAQQAEQAVAATTAARRSVIQDRDRVASLAEEANRGQREADDLARMREGFRDFEKYVAERVQPILADRTAEFLSLVTDGHYGQVEFDNDYGLFIFDEDRPFPVADFSGGERDVASLCARLALSSIVGDQAAHPPGFVVLDEVFGSLDQERRALLLDTLRNLTGQDQALQQLFVISHVEEVNASPLVDEVWRVSAANGLSKLEQDPRDGTISPGQAGQLLLGDD
ncbi:MAG: AAA family ATPase [Chloroflexota bacterium]